MDTAQVIELMNVNKPTYERPLRVVKPVVESLVTNTVMDGTLNLMDESKEIRFPSDWALNFKKSVRCNDGKTRSFPCPPTEYEYFTRVGFPPLRLVAA